MVYEQLPSQAGIQIVNSLPEYIKSAPAPEAFKACLKIFGPQMQFIVSTSS